MEFTAHIEGSRTQTVATHSTQTAEIAIHYAQKIKLENTAEIQGKFHDLGKLCQDFDDYINNRNHFHRGEIDHAYAGAKYLCDFVLRTKGHSLQKVTAFIARTIISHHGLHDWVNEDGKKYFSERLSKTERYEEICSNAQKMITEETLSELLKKSAAEFSILDRKCYNLSMKYPARSQEINSSAEEKNPPPAKNPHQIYLFYSRLLERLMQSILIDADRTNTADFICGHSTEASYCIEKVWMEMNSKLDKKYLNFSKKTDKISRQRTAIADRCLAFANHQVGVCRLIVPTGGGKTLSSLRFAAKYCKEYDKERIFYIAPFMSILEQNSDVIREIAGEKNFLEHYSDFAQSMDDDDELAEYELRSEKWDLPVISTTLVQFLDTIFSDKTASVRRFHRLCNSVIIIDEVQAIPTKCVHLFNLAVNFLAHICNSSIVLCTATQPCFENTEFPILFDEAENMNIPFQEDFAAFRRTNLITKCRQEAFTYEETAEFCAERFEAEGNLLLIVNTKNAAASIHALLQKRYDGTDVRIIHLSTGMCPEHRRAVIKEICTKVNPDSHCRIICVTTQLIEAGVNISFPCVVRSLAGLDNAAQAAGRCNRNGDYPAICNAYIINIHPSDENLRNLPEIRQRQSAAKPVIASGKYVDLLEVDAMNDYFNRFYHEQEKLLGYPVEVDDDKTTLIDLLSINSQRNARKGRTTEKQIQAGMQAFKTAGCHFHVIDSQTEEVIVPYNKEAEQLILDLNSDLALSEITTKLRAAQKYVVSIYTNQKKQLTDSGAVYLLKCGVLALNKEFYDRDGIGLDFTSKNKNLDVLIY